MSTAASNIAAPALPPFARSVAIANAGSGKTYTLANRILAWSVAELRATGACSPERMLAVTFTRKAAAEILARVLIHAARGATSDAAGGEFGALLGPDAPPPTADEYRAVLAALCASLHRLSVGTIDGYFHRVASAMPAELGLPPEWTIGDPAELSELRAEVAAELLAHEGSAELVSQLELGAPKQSALEAILSVLGTERGGRSAPSSLLDIYRATQAFVHGGSDGRHRAWLWAVELGRTLPRPDDAAWDALADAVSRMDLATTKDGSPRKSWMNAQRKVVELLRRRDFLALLDNTMVANLCRSQPFDGQPAFGSAIPAMAAVGRAMRAELVHLVASRMKGAVEVLAKADLAMREAQAVQGIYGFSDLTARIAAASADDGPLADAGVVGDAMGARIRDLAIDEAQDTSVEQYRSLSPLLRAALADGGDGRFLLVGDTKQSIYGWRGGTPGLVEAIRAEHSRALGPGETLATSYRSSPVVLAFVNTVFGALDDHLMPLSRTEEADELVELAPFLEKHGADGMFTVNPLRRAIAQWRFERHVAAHDLSGSVSAYLVGTEAVAAPKKAPGKKAAGKKPAAGTGACGGPTEGGSVAMGNASLGASCAQPAEDAGDTPAPPPVVLEPADCAARIAARLHAEHPSRSIAVLARSNKDVADVIARLRGLGVDASDEGRSTLLDSAPVAGIVMLLRLVDDPADRIAHFMVSRGTMGQVTGLAPLESHAEKPGATEAAAAFARCMRAEIADAGLPAVIDRLVSAVLGRGVSARDAARLGRLRAIAERFADATPARMQGFLREVEHDAADSSAARRVRVMTVHKAKGLEFDEVVLMSLDESWGQRLGAWGVLTNGPKEAPSLVAPLWNAKARVFVPELELFAREERRRRMLDELSAFYVALTRARHGLHLLFDVAEVQTGPSSAGLAKRALAAPADPADPRVARWFGGFAAELAVASKPSVEPFWRVDHAGSVQPKPAVHATAARSGLRGADLLAPGTLRSSARPPSSGEASQTHGPQGETGQPVSAGPDAGAHGAGPSEPPLWALDPFDDGDTALRGVLVHECFREVRSADALADAGSRAALLARALVRAEVEKCEPVKPELAKAVGELLARVARLGSPVGRALTVGSDDLVRTEVPFVHQRSDGSLLRGRIDRLVLHREELPAGGTRVTGATIVDFKTGAVQNPEPRMQALVAHYREQLAAYREAVAALWRLDPSAVRATLLFVDRDEVRELAF